MKITEVATAVPMARSTIMAWVDAGAVKPRKVPNDAVAVGYVYQFTAADVIKLRKLKRAAGRPRVSKETA